MSFDLNSLDAPGPSLNTPLRRVRRAVELLGEAGCGTDPWYRAGARHLGNGQPKIKLPDTGRYAYLQRPSTLAKNFDTNTENLQVWSRTMGALGAALNPDKAQSLIGLDLKDKDAKKLANRISLELANDDAEADEGMQYGNLTHALCEARAKGLDWRSFLEPLDEDQQAMFVAVVESFEEALQRHEIEVVATEVTVVNLKQNAAGNLDFYGQHKGSVKVCDIKTNAGDWLYRSFLSFILQTWLYATAEAMYDPFSEQFVEMPGPVDQDEALIFHTDWRTWFTEGEVHTVVYRLPIGEVGPVAFDLARQVEELKKTAGQMVSAVEADLEAILKASIEQVQQGGQQILEALDAATKVADQDIASRQAITAREAAEQVVAAFPGSEVVEAQPLPERPTGPPPMPSYRPRNGGLEDLLDYYRARLYELVEHGHSEALFAAWVAAGLPDITDPLCPTDGATFARCDEVLTDVEKETGHYVEQYEVDALIRLVNELTPERVEEFMGLWNMTGWNTAHRFTRGRADVVTFWLHEIAYGAKK